MGLFKKIFSEDILVSEKNQHKYKLLLSLESKRDSYIISYLDNNCKITKEINENDLQNLKFIQKTKNLYYKKFRDVDADTVLNEMDTGSTGAGGISTDVAGVGGTASEPFSDDFYAPDDARNLFGSGDKKKKKGKKKKKSGNLNKNDPNFPTVQRPKITDMINNGKK